MTKRNPIAWGLLLLGFAAGCVGRQAADELAALRARADTTERNKAVARRWFCELSRGNFEPLYNDLFHPDSRQYIPPDAKPLGFEEYKPLAKRMYEAFPRITHSVKDIFTEGDRVAAVIHVHTKHEGEFAGIPATDRNLEWTAIAVFRFMDGRIMARWEIGDILGLYEQLGMELKPKAAGSEGF